MESNHSEIFAVITNKINLEWNKKSIDKIKYVIYIGLALEIASVPDQQFYDINMSTDACEMNRSVTLKCRIIDLQ